MKNNDKYVEAKKYLQKRYPKELSDKRWNTSDINDDWVTEMMTDFASQSKPQLNIEKMVDGIVDSLGETSKGNDYQIHSIRGERWITHKEIGSGEPLKQWLKSEIEKHIEQSKPEEIKPVDTKTVDAVEFAEWLKVNNHELKLDSGYRSDEHNAKLLNLYKQDIESKK